MIKILTSDEFEIEIPLKIANMSKTIKNMIEEMEDCDSIIPIHDVTKEVFEQIIVYCNHHLNDPEDKRTEKEKKRTDNISEWDKEFCSIDKESLFKIINAANYLDISGLLEITCKTIANMIKGKSPEEIREMFGIENDFTPEEEERIRKENEWCEEL